MRPGGGAFGVLTFWAFVKPSAWRPWSSIWAWSWDPLRFMRRHPPHHLSPARASYRAGPDPEARLSRPKSPQQRSDQARKPVISEQDSCSLALMSGLSRERQPPRPCDAGDLADSLHANSAGYAKIGARLHAQA